MATHSSVLACKIPRTEEPGRLQSMGSQSQTPLSDFISLHFSCTGGHWQLVNSLSHQSTDSLKVTMAF